MPEIKAGPELDARLCSLLQKKPRHALIRSAWDAPALSPNGGFWIWRVRSSDWRPIPISTGDWAAMGKAAEYLTSKKYHISATYYDRWDTPQWGVVIAWDVEATNGIADTLPEAFSLAASEALEKRVGAEA